MNYLNLGGLEAISKETKGHVKGPHINIAMKRPLCKQCHQKHAGVNYKKNGRTYYRSKCDSCLRLAKKEKPPKPNWAKSGYKKKMTCDRCGFKARWAKQIVVYYTDGDLNNTKRNNLKSICLNCTVDIEKQDIPWVQDHSLVPDN